MNFLNIERLFYNHRVIHKRKISLYYRFYYIFALLYTLFLSFKLCVNCHPHPRKDTNKRESKWKKGFFRFCCIAWLNIQSLLNWRWWWFGDYEEDHLNFLHASNPTCLFIENSLKMMICWYFSQRESINMVIFCG